MVFSPGCNCFRELEGTASRHSGGGGSSGESSESGGGEGSVVLSELDGCGAGQFDK